MNISVERGKEIKSQRQRELEELRSKGVAKTRREKLKDFASPLQTAEEVRQFLLDCRDQSRRESRSWEPVVPVSTKSTASNAFSFVDGPGTMNINDWYMMQRKRQQELRKRRQEAEQMLHGFRGYYDLEWMGSPRAKSRGSGGGGARHLSYENPMDDHLPDPDQHIRHQSAIPQFGSNDSTGSDEYGNFLSSPPNRLHPNRMSFLSEHQHYDGTHYPRTEQDMEVSKGVRLFNDETAIDHVQGFPGKTPYTRRYVGMGIDTTESVERLRKAKSTEGNGWDNSFANNFGEDARTNLSENRFMPIREQAENRESSGTNIRDGDDASMDRDGPPQVRTQDSVDDAEPVPITIWRDFISDEPDAKFKPEAGRYHLYASYACPGSHRALIVRALKGLEDVVSVTIVHPTWRHTNCNDPHDKHRGWVFGNPGGEPFQNTMGRGGPFPPAYKGNDPDPILNAYSVRDLYEYAKDTSGRYTIPLLWDKKLQTIVNNESSDISYMLNSSFNDFAKDPELDLYTEDDEDGLDRLNEVSQWLYPMMIHGVYRCGFAKTQRAYDQAIQELTDAFDAADDLLQRQRYLTGDTLTDADIRLFVTLIRFDEVYAFYFRANTRLVMLTPSLLNFCREIYQMPGVAETCQMEQIKAHFFGSHAEWNKYSVVPRGLGFMKHLEVPHNRDEICREDAPTQESI